MKIFLLSILFLSCASSQYNAFDKFHESFEKRDFKGIENILSDHITIESSTSKEKYEKYQYVEDMKNWATVFDTKWIVLSKTEIGDTVYSVEVDSDIFKDYFYDGGNKVNLKYVEKNDKLIYLSWDMGENDKNKIYEKRYRAFAEWCYKKYPYRYFNLQYQSQRALLEIKFMLENYLKEKTIF